MKKVFYDNKGFSLVEIMITVGIFAMMMAGLFAALNVGNTSSRVNFAKISIQQDLRRAMDSMQYDLRQAGSGSISNVPADGTAYSSIIFQIPDGISGGKTSWDTDAITLSVVSNKLQRVKGASTKILASNVSSVQFRREAATPDLLEVEMQAQKTTTSGRVVTYDLDFNVGLRN